MVNIAIDGPAGAGKSTIAKLLAAELGYMYLDTGAMYRAVGLFASVNGVNIESEQEMQAALEKIDLDMAVAGGQQVIKINGEDVTAQIREHYVSSLASKVSALHCVRLAMVKIQREIAKKNNVILDGRDIGSFVLPDADYKIYLTASVDSRAHRRWLELSKKGETCDEATVKKDIAARDYADMHRDFAPLVKAERAIEVDTTALTIEEVVKKLLEIVKNGNNRK